MKSGHRRHRTKVEPPLAPKAPEALPVSVVLTRAVACIQSQKVAEAVELLRPLQLEDLDEAQNALVGLIYLGAGADQNALLFLDRALAASQPVAALFAHRALACQRLGRIPDALASYDRAIAAQSLDAVGHYNRGHLLQEMGRLDDAIAAYDCALRLNPAYPEALYAGGMVLQAAGRLESAIEFFDEALRLKPDFAEAWFGRGNALQKLKRLHAAIESYDAALALAPDHPDILSNRGVAFYELGRNMEALASYEKALHIWPDFPVVLLNRANIHLRLDQPAAALADCETALTHRPGYIEALGSRGIALRDLGRVDEAIAAFDEVLTLDPDFVTARNNRGGARLLIGDFERGLEDYEFRWIGGETPKRKLKLPLPEWPGQVKPGEHILVFDEQGFGDAIQFARYLPLLTEAGANVTFFCRRKLHRLLGSLGSGIKFVDTIGKVEDFDCQIALSSLPFACETRLETIPAKTPYIFAEPKQISHWKNHIGSEGFKIGLCWHGNQDPRADPNRSIPLISYAPLAIEGVRLISLQTGQGAIQLDSLPPSLNVEHLGADFDAGPDAFVDTAAVMQSLDLIVTCDTSIAHVAGALGRPVWLLLKTIPDWRWFLGRDDSPWYPTMRLFRRREGENWDELMVHVALALRDRLEHPNT